MIRYFIWLWAQFRRAKPLSTYQRVFALSPINGAAHLREHLPPEGSGDFGAGR